MFPKTLRNGGPQNDGPMEKVTPIQKKRAILGINSLVFWSVYPRHPVIPPEVLLCLDGMICWVQTPNLRSWPWMSRDNFLNLKLLFYPKYPDPSKVPILRSRTPAIQVPTPALEGPRILRVAHMR